MSSNNEIFEALNTIEEASRVVSKQFHTLRPADQRAVLLRLETINKQVDEVQRRALATVVTGPTPVEFVGASWDQVLARRLRIPVAEAKRRIADAVRDVPRSA